MVNGVGSMKEVHRGKKTGKKREKKCDACKDKCKLHVAAQTISRAAGLQAEHTNTLCTREW